jgi:hypothetical protein
VAGHSEESEPVESEKKAGQSGNVIHACGLRVGVLDTAIFVRPQARSKHLSPRRNLPPGHPPPSFIAKSQ